MGDENAAPLLLRTRARRCQARYKLRTPAFGPRALYSAAPLRPLTANSPMEREKERRRANAPNAATVSSRFYFRTHERFISVQRGDKGATTTNREEAPRHRCSKGRVRKGGKGDSGWIFTVCSDADDRYIAVAIFVTVTKTGAGLISIRAEKQAKRTKEKGQTLPTCVYTDTYAPEKL